MLLQALANEVQASNFFQGRCMKEKLKSASDLRSNERYSKAVKTYNQLTFQRNCH